ncbi:unnamed protein product, partial [Ectocarpus sp. 12 AP-2014]
MVLSADAESDMSKNVSVATGGIAATGGGGGAPAGPKAEGVDAIQGKLAGIQIDGGVARQQPNPNSNNYFGYGHSGGLALDVDGSGGGGGGAPTQGVAAPSSTAGGSGGVTAGGGGGGMGGGHTPGGTTDGSGVSRRFGVPIASSSRNAGAGGNNRGGGGGGVSGLAGAGVAFGDDRRRAGGAASGGVGGRRAGGGSGSGSGMGGVGRGSSGRASGARGGYESAAAAAASPVRGPVDYSQLQQALSHMGYGGGGGGNDTMSPTSATGMGGQAQQQQQQQQQQPGLYSTGSNGSNHSGGMGQPVGLSIHHDPSQQAAMMGQIQTGMYYGTAAGYGAQAPGTPVLAHMNHPQNVAAAGGGYPSSPGHSASYGMQPSQQMGTMEMQQGMPSGYPVGAGGMVHSMGVVPGTPTMQSMQSPYGGYWPSGDVSGYSGMSTGISTYGGGYGASDSGVRDTASTTSTINKASHNHSTHHYLASPTGSVAGPPSGQRAVGDQYGGARQHQQPQHQQQQHQAAYDGRDYSGGAYSLSPSGGLTGYGMASYGYGYGGQPASPKMDSLGREKRRDRVRSGSIVSMGGGAGFGSGADPQRETELSVAMENLTLEEIDGNVFRMSKDQV